jgi:transposase
MLKNSLISILDQVFPGINELFTSPEKENGHQKWIDFVSVFWHSECVSDLNFKAFKAKYQRFCEKFGYHFRLDKTEEIYQKAKQNFCTIPKNDYTKNLVLSSVSQINSICENIANVKNIMTEIASKLPEYEVVLNMNSVGKTTTSGLIAELGEINKFPKRSSLARFAGIEPPENQSGTYYRNSRKISKQGSPHLRKILFTIMLAIIQNKNPDDPIYQFISRKKAEGKPYKVRMIAGANKFLRMYYAKVKEIYDENFVFA